MKEAFIGFDFLLLQQRLGLVIGIIHSTPCPNCHGPRSWGLATNRSNQETLWNVIRSMSSWPRIAFLDTGRDHPTPYMVVLHRIGYIWVGGNWVCMSNKISVIESLLGRIRIGCSQCWTCMANWVPLYSLNHLFSNSKDHFFSNK